MAYILQEAWVQNTSVVEKVPQAVAGPNLAGESPRGLCPAARCGQLFCRSPHFNWGADYREKNE
ncbi:hypothetical protein P7K49_014791 [Saguinus oedipus]|uniref:Uncharacterized protein n=1 Tax=Saguinus oedipus TaxID=9490 RepID=A0ABQ9VA41_SAGOE|nr:hypothetical protein P7K49_014791 [Saguinus oedipus]